MKLEDGSWTVITVNEGFSQGCPASPTFAAIVLNDILTTIQKELNVRAKQRQANGDKGDDGYGTIAIILAYVDDTNRSQCRIGRREINHPHSVQHCNTQRRLYLQLNRFSGWQTLCREWT